MATHVLSDPALTEDAVLSLVEERLVVAMHEIRQPLAAVLALAGAAASAGDVPPTTRAYLDRIVEQVHEVSGAAWSVLGAQPSGRHPEDSATDLEEVLDSVSRSVDVTWTGTLVRRGHSGGAVVRGSRPRLRRCVLNVVENAVRAAGPRGQVLVTVRRDGTWVRVIVEDDGPGFGRIPAGPGLGLAVTRTTLRDVGGSLSIGMTSSLGGACVAICLPVQIAVPEQGDEAPPERADRTRGWPE